MNRIAFPSLALVLSLLILLLIGGVASGCRNAEAAKAEHLSRGEVFLNNKKYQEASIEFRNTIQLDERLAAGYWGLARAYEGMQRFNEAFEELRRAVDLDANNLDARIKLGNYYLLIRPPQTGEAERLANEVLHQNPNNIEGNILLGNVLFLDGHPQEALAKLTHAIELEPKRVESYLSLARFYTTTRALEKAEETYKRAIQLNDTSAVAHTEYGKFLITVNKPEQAETELARAVQVEGNNRDSRFILASFYLVNKRLDKAEDAYKALAELDKDRPEGRSVLADFYAAVGRYSEAVGIYREIVAKSPEYSRGRYRLGELMLQSGDKAGANVQVEQTLKKNNRDADALLLRARIRMQNGQPKELRAAIEDLKQVLKQESSSRQALYFMAEANFRIGRIDQARAFVGDLQRFHPDYLPAKLMETQINLAAGDAKEAVRGASELLERIAKASPDTETSPQLLSELYAKTLVARATAYLEMHDTKSARADFMAARDAAPRFPSSYVNLAAVSLKENKIDEATGYFEQALAIDNTDFDALNGLIENIYTRKHRLDLAHQRIGQALSEQPNSASLHFLKGNIYGHEMNAQNAEAEFRRALEIDPDYLPAYSSLGALFGNMEQPERAIDEYRKILDRNENPSTYTLIGMLEEGRSNFAAASQAYRMALDLDQNSTIAANNLAWMIAVQGNGNLDEAVRLAQGAVQRYPSMPGFADTLGWIYQKKGLYGPAAEQLERAVARDSANATYRYHLGMAFAGKGDKAGARREIEEALRQAGRLSPADADEARKTLTAL